MTITGNWKVIDWWVVAACRAKLRYKVCECHKFTAAWFEQVNTMPDCFTGYIQNLINIGLKFNMPATGEKWLVKLGVHIFICFITIYHFLKISLKSKNMAKFNMATPPKANSNYASSLHKLSLFCMHNFEVWWWDDEMVECLMKWLDEKLGWRDNGMVRWWCYKLKL